MRTFTKLCLLLVVLTFSSTLFAQNSPNSYIGNNAPEKMELIQLLHGSDVLVPLAIEGTSKAEGDDCTDPIDIMALPFSDLNQTTAGRGNHYDNTCLNDFDGGEDIVYQIDLAAPATIQVTLDPKGTSHTGIALSDGCPLSALCLAISYDLNNGGSAPHGFTISLDAGSYFIMVDTWPNPTSIPDFDLTVTQVTSVENDECANATEIGEVSDLAFSTELATNTPGGYTTGPEIWYNYTAGFSGLAVIDLCGSDYDTDLGVFPGTFCPPDTANLIASNDDACGYDGLQSKVIISVIVGEVYTIEIGGFDGQTGEGVLSIYEFEECTLSCPSGGILEGEICGDNINGGCNMEIPGFTDISDETIICGNLWSFAGTRDTDWFRVVLSSPGSLKMNVQTEDQVVFGLVGQIVPGVPGCENVTDFLSAYKILAPCQEDFVQVINLPKGTYYLFIAPMDYYGTYCPGFSYIADFEVTELPSGYITGNVLGSDIIAGIEGVDIFAGDALVQTNASGNYLMEVPVGIYTVEANGYDAGYETKSVTDVIVTENNFTTVNFVLDPLPAPELLSITADIEQIELTWAPIAPPKADGSKILMGDIFSTNDYIPGATMNLDFTMNIYSPDFEWGVSAEMNFPPEFTPVSAGLLNNVPGVVVGQKVIWTGLFYESSNPEEIDFSVEVEVAAGAAGPLVALYLVEGDGYGLDPHSFEGGVTIYEDGGTYVPTFNVYRRKIIPGTPTYFIPIAYGVIGNYYLDEIYPGGDEWCYLVKQILPDGSESPESNILCATPLIRPGSLCDYPIDYGTVNDPAIAEALVRAEDERWFEFDVPHPMDVAITLDNLNFIAELTLFSDCEGTMLADKNYCGGAGYDLEKIYGMLPAGTYYAKVNGLNETFGDFEIFITQVQLLTIREGWSGFSTYMNPTGDLNIASQLECLAEDMIITVRQTPYGIWWPSQNWNTIGDIYNTYGYKSKMTEIGTTVIYGTETNDKTVVLPAGSSYLPVRVTAPVSTDDLQDQLEGELLILFDIYDPTKVIWPDGGLYSLDWLVPDHAYMINMFVPSSYTYPAVSKAPAPAIAEPEPMVKSPIWNEVTNTGNPHFIVIDKSAMNMLESGDMIGVFDANSRCVGIAEFTSNENNLFLPVFGDDEFTELKDGMADGELMIFKLFKASSNKEYELQVTFSQEMSNSDGLFELNGMSMIVELKVGSTSISEGDLNALAVYPNPTNGLVNISGINQVVNIVVTNIQGQDILATSLSKDSSLDLSGHSKGVYFIRLTTENSVRIERVVLK